MLIAALEDALALERRRVQQLQERNDRLTEALTRKEGGQLNLPIEPVYRAPEAAPEGPASGPGAEVVNGWWRSMCAGGRISSPVVEAKVPAPE